MEKQMDLLRRIVKKLHERGYREIRVAHLPEFEDHRPPLIYWEETDEGYRPDIMARRGATEYLFLIPSSETLTDESIRRQIELFSTYAQYFHHHLCLLVSESAEGEAINILRGIGADERLTHVLVL